MSEQLRSAEVAGDPWASMLATSIDAWYAGDLARGRAACEALLSRRDLPDHIRTQTERNLMHYSRSLPDLAPGVTFFHLPRFAERGWSWFNPTLAVDDDGVHVLVRSSNYTIQSGRRYAAFDREGLIRTRYTRLRLDDGFGLRELAPVHDETGEDGRSDFPVRGYEDCRVVVKDDAWHVIGTARDRNPDGVCQQVHMRLESDAWVDARKISAPDDGYQKNWMPFVADGELVAIQYCHPLTVVRIGPETNGAETIARHETTPLARSFRGGSQGVAIEHGTLFVIHEAVDRSAEERVYLHRFIVVDA